jgi:hypothetical protein
MAAAQTVLVYSPGLDGHRPVYCRVLADVLLEAGYRVVLASSGLAAAPQLAGLATDPMMSFVDVSALRRGGRDVELRQFVRLVTQREADVTLLVEADDHLRLIASQALPGLPRIPGRRVGIFLRSTGYVHSGRRRMAWRRRLRHWLRGRFLDALDDPCTFHERLMPHLSLLESALCLDETFVAGRGAPYEWLPDIYRPFSADGDAPSADEQRWIAQLHAFKERAGERPLFVYYGTEQARRGYGTLLRLAAREDGCFVHCGARAADGHDEGAEAARRELEEQGRLFETGAYLEGFAVAEEFLGAGSCVILPYRRHYVSSGVMLQALAAGRPVLVPETGLMGWRTRTQRLGRTYPVDREDLLVEEYERLVATGPAAFAGDIESFLTYFAEERVRAAVLRAVAGAGAAPPTPCDPAPSPRSTS